MATKKNPSGSPRRSSAEKRKIDRIVTLYQSGWTLKRIMETERVSERELKRILADRSIPSGLIGHLTRFPVTDPNFLEKYIDSIYEQFKLGVSMEKIAAQKNIDRRLVRELLLRRNVKHFPSGRRKTRIDKSTCTRIVKLYESGLHVAAVHEQTKVQRHLITEILRQHGVQIRPPGRRGTVINKRQLEKAVRLYQSGVPLVRTAKMYGITPQFLKKALCERNIPVRPRHPQPPTASNPLPHKK